MLSIRAVRSQQYLDVAPAQPAQSVLPLSTTEQYKCIKQTFCGESCRARKNIYVSQETTVALIKYIDEHFADTKKLYYFFDYIVAMQIIDGQTRLFHFQNGADDIVVIPIELHRQGQLLYAVVVRNDREAGQQWKIIEAERIEDAFMTADDLRERFGIFERHLPVGSHRRRNDFDEYLECIVISKSVIRGTKWAQIPIHQRPKTQMQRLNLCQFEQLVLRSLRQRGDEWVAMAHIKPKVREYYVEKLLPVWVPEREQFVAVAFRHSDNGYTKVSGIHFDLADVKNKANLVDIDRAQTVRWLNRRDHYHLQCQEQRASSVPAPLSSWSVIQQPQMMHSQSVPANVPMNHSLVNAEQPMQTAPPVSLNSEAAEFVPSSAVCLSTVPPSQSPSPALEPIREERSDEYEVMSPRGIASN